MKKLRLLSLVGITSIALAHAGWAAGHGGGGNGFGGGGGFAGGRGGGFGGGGHFGGGGRGGFGGAHQFGGGAFNAPHINFAGAGNRGGGVGFGMPRSSGGVPHIATRATHVPSRQPVLHSTSGNSARGLTNAGRGNRTGNASGRATAALNRRSNRGMNPSTTRPSQTSQHRGLNGRRDHIAERHDANWHRDWDRRHAHFDHDRFFVFEDGFWFGLDAGFFPWDYLPYYTDDYYPYDYYTADVPQYDNENTEAVDNGVPVADPTVQAVQTQLTQLGYYNGPADGFFGPATRDAVAKYQIARNLSVTGSLSPDMLQSLGLPQATGS
jgi:Putative peptidoglycan binding domain